MYHNTSASVILSIMLLVGCGDKVVTSTVDNLDGLCGTKELILDFGEDLFVYTHLVWEFTEDRYLITQTVYDVVGRHHQVDALKLPDDKVIFTVSGLYWVGSGEHPTGILLQEDLFRTYKRDGTFDERHGLTSVPYMLPFRIGASGTPFKIDRDTFEPCD